jgi:putative hydrolase of HD superfamily
MSFVDFSEVIRMLKRVPRAGWITRGVKIEHVESVAEHILSVAMLSMFFADLLQGRGYDVDFEKIVKMALLHDIGESITFDINKRHLEMLGEVGRKLKKEVEAKSIQLALETIPEKSVSRAYAELLLKEYIEAKTFEAKVVHAADCFDILVQIIEYEKMGYLPSLFDNLWEETKERIVALKIGLVLPFMESLEKERGKLRSRSKP